MAVGLSEPEMLPPVPGLRLSAGSAGIYKKLRPDLVLIELVKGARASAVFTENRFAAAPVLLAREHIGADVPLYCLINAGNANAGTGKAGLDAVAKICGELANIADCRLSNILPFSTGVIGEPLPAEKICRYLPVLYANLAEDAWLQAARAIMTTDTVAKAVTRQVMIDGVYVTINGIAKGSGMIRPDMATMLAFLGTDANISQSVLDEMLGKAIECSFNRICVDGDTSTNDACLLMATGTAGNSEINSFSSDSYASLSEVVTEVCTVLAQAIVRDGEGASKFITIEVEGGRSRDECLNAGYAVATSPLVKTAFYASDPNWGRILAAVGRCGIDDLDINNIELYLNDVAVVERGGRTESYTEEAGTAAMKGAEITVRIRMNRGSVSETLWTCDLSHEYVRINAEYRS